MSMPLYQMPKANRADGDKQYMGELTKTQNAGKNSPGPVYMFSDNVKYDQVSNSSIQIPNGEL